MKEFIQPNVPHKYHWMVHMGAATTGEMVIKYSSLILFQCTIFLN